MTLRRGLLRAAGAEATVTFATFDPTRTDGAITLSNGNLTATKTSIGLRSSFLDTDLGFGLWSMEVTPTPDLVLDTHDLRLYIGMGRTAELNPGSGLGVSSSWGTCVRMEDGRPWSNGGAGAIGTYDKQITGPILMVFNADNNTVLASIGGVLVPYVPLTNAGSDTLTPGVSLWANVSLGATINTGQSAFSAGNEAMISAYETAQSVTINRGVWS